MTFQTELFALLKKHNLHLSGTLRIIELSDKWDVSTAQLSVEPTRNLYGGPDRGGPFLMATIREKPTEPVSIRGKAAQIMSDIKEYHCPVTGKLIDGKREHRENLKRNNCRLLEPGETREHRKNADRQREASLDTMVSKAVRELANEF